MEHLPLFKNKKERIYLSFFLLLLFSCNLFFNYLKYQNFIKDEVFQTQGTIVNIYEKETFDVLKITTDNFTVFTSANKDISYSKLQNTNLFILTKNINFYQYLKGFYAKSFNISILKNSNNKITIYNFIEKQHSNKSIASFYNALFLATPVDKNIRDMCSNFGVSHLVAISGFHLGVISLVLYFILHLLYNNIHQKYFPYRNKRFDIMLVITIILFIYLLFVNLVPSLLRAFVMFVFALFLLRNNIKLLSFETLFIIVLFIIALFPKLLFSLSLWFSVAGVFYIFLFLHYFKNSNKYLQFIVFNFWIYLAMNPIVHYFFPTTTIEQLLSPIFTLLFTIFYPFVALLHILQIGDLLDSLILYLMNYNITPIDISTPFVFFLFYITISLLSIFYKYLFFFLNILFLIFNFFIFIK